MVQNTLQHHQRIQKHSELYSHTEWYSQQVGRPFPEHHEAYFDVDSAIGLFYNSFSFMVVSRKTQIYMKAGVYSAWIMWALVGEESGSRSNWDRSGGARLEPAQLRSEAEGVRQGLPGRS